jgi:hypothetical protein
MHDIFFMLFQNFIVFIMLFCLKSLDLVLFFCFATYWWDQRFDIDIEYSSRHDLALREIFHQKLSDFNQFDDLRSFYD